MTRSAQITYKIVHKDNGGTCTRWALRCFTGSSGYPIQLTSSRLYRNLLIARRARRRWIKKGVRP